MTWWYIGAIALVCLFGLSILNWLLIKDDPKFSCSYLGSIGLMPFMGLLYLMFGLYYLWYLLRGRKEHPFKAPEYRREPRMRDLIKMGSILDGRRK
jgi:hypothetical protein